MCPCPADEANETCLHVVVGDGRRGAVLQQEHQVAVVEVVPLEYIEFLSILRNVKDKQSLDTLMMTLPACLTNTALCLSSREALLPPSCERPFTSIHIIHVIHNHIYHIDLISYPNEYLEFKQSTSGTILLFNLGNIARIANAVQCHN